MYEGRASYADVHNNYCWNLERGIVRLIGFTWFKWGTTQLAHTEFYIYFYGPFFNLIHVLSINKMCIKIYLKCLPI